jgi:hypothetical protein
MKKSDLFQLSMIWVVISRIFAMRNYRKKKEIKETLRKKKRKSKRTNSSLETHSFTPLNGRRLNSMRFIVRRDVSTSGMREVSNRMKNAHLVQTKSRPMNLNTFILYGRLEESVAGPLNGKGKRWQSMAKLGTGTLEPFLREDIFNAMLKAFTEEERNEVRIKTGSGKKGSWGNVLDYSDGVAIPYQVPLEKVMYRQNGRSNCFIASFFTVLHAAGYKKEAVNIF